MVFIALAYVLIGKFHWDYTIWWIDMPMHFFGGFWQAMFFIWFFSIKNFTFFQVPINKIDTQLIVKAVLFVLLIGILWEIFEVLVHNYVPHNTFSILDTTSDIFFDVAGGIAAILYALRKSYPKVVEEIMPVLGSAVQLE